MVKISNVFCNRFNGKSDKILCLVRENERRAMSGIPRVLLLGDSILIISRKDNNSKSETFETVEPIGKRVLIRKDEDKKQTKGGIQLPDNIEIPTITRRIVSVGQEG